MVMLGSEDKSRRFSNDFRYRHHLNQGFGEIKARIFGVDR